MTRQKAVLYLMPNGFYYFGEQFTSVLSMAIPPEVLSDLEVKDVEKFSSLIQTFVSSYKLAPSSIAIVLSPWMVFEEDIESLAQESVQKKDNLLISPAVNHATELQEGVNQDVAHFLSLVPFENILSRVFPTQKGVKVIAANQDVVRVLGETFFQFGSEVSIVVPYFAIPGLSFEANGFPMEYASLALSKFESLKQFTILNHSVAKIKEEPARQDQEEKQSPQKKDSKRLFALVGLFVFLILALIVTYFTLGVSQTPTPTPAASASDSIAKPAEVAPSVDTSIATAEAALSPDIVVGVYSQLGQEKEVETVKNKLTEIGVDNLVENISTASPSRTTILFSKNIPLSERETLVAKLSEIISDILIQETEADDLVVRIVLSASN